MFWFMDTFEDYLAGRFVSGVGCGAAITVVSTYLGEMGHYLYDIKFLTEICTTSFISNLIF